MGFNQPGLQGAYIVLRESLGKIQNPYNDGYIQRDCKHELYLLKCWLEDEYSKLPKFTGEDEWEQNRLVEILKR